MFNKMIEEGYINLHKLLLKEYTRLGLQEKEVVVLSQLVSLIEKKKQTLSLKSIARMTHFSSNEVGEILEQLIVNQYISTGLEMKQDGKEREIFSLEPLYKKITELFLEDVKEEKEKQNDNEIRQVILTLEEVFRKSLKPYDLQMIQQWFMDGYQKKDVDLALETAVNHHKLNMNYMDRIIRSNDERVLDDLDDEKKELIDKLIKGIM